MQQFYDSNFNVKPLLFKWSSISADDIKRLMGLQEDDNQLYVASLLEVNLSLEFHDGSAQLLRSYQLKGSVLSFENFEKEIKKICRVCFLTICFISLLV